MAVTLTEAAAKRVSQHMPSVSGITDKTAPSDQNCDKDANAQMRLRLGIKVMGCTGFAYVLDYTDKVGQDDHEFESRGIRIVVDEESLAAVSGTEIDFRKEGLSESFQFANPNVKASCGCGESFTVD